jgi:hypothetical protein
MTRMTNRDTMEIYSIFGQIEDVAAQIMIADGTATKIEAKDIPESERFNKDGEPVKYAVMIYGRALNHKFEELIAGLRA